jgi:hypothetical protein
MAALENANVIVSKSPADMGVLLKKVSYMNEYNAERSHVAKYPMSNDSFITRL